MGDQDVLFMVKDVHQRVEDGLFELNNWEEKFLESVGSQILQGGPLSEKQDAKLVEIWRRALS